jgi:two-component system response regulator CpxR
MLTARGDEVDRVLGLELGADDYLPKPFSSRELVARIRAILRRATATREPAGATSSKHEHLVVGDLELDSGAREVRRGGQLVELTAVEFNLLELLLRDAGDVVSRDTIAQQVFARALMPYDRSLDTHVSNLRRKLGFDSRGSDRIKTVRSIGYIYVRPAASQ